MASQRIVSFVKYLPPEKFDIRVIAWSDEHVDAPVLAGVSYNVTYLPNSQLLRRFTFRQRSSFFIHRLKSLFNVCLAITGINEMAGWGSAVDAELNKIQMTWKPEFIFATYPYAETLEAGIRAAKKMGVPLIADLRDGITNNYSRNVLVRRRLLSLEQRVMKSVRSVLTVSAPLVEFLRQNHPGFRGEIRELRNGFDFVPGNSGLFNEVFTVTYAGTFYGGRKPAQFFRAVISLMNQGRIKEIRLCFPGVIRNFHVPEELEGRCEFLPWIPYEEVVKMLKDSDALLLIQEKSDFKGAYSAKVFDYLGVLRPVIAVVDEDDVAAQLILECNAGFIAGWNDQEKTEKAIIGALELWEKKKFPEFNRRLIEAHHRKVLAKILESELDELSQENG